MQTHENYIHQIAAIVARRLNTGEREAIEAIKLVYGAGASGRRGVTYYNKWQNGSETPNPFVEICALGQSSWIQVAGTTLHELAHVVAGWQAGHSKDWKEACARVGLRNARATGHRYMLASFDPDVRLAIEALVKPEEGEPVDTLSALGIAFKPCTAGIGTRGGKSRGKGSGSRMRLYECACQPMVKVRHAGGRFGADCHFCKAPFLLA